MMTRPEAEAIYDAGKETVVHVLLMRDARIHALEEHVQSLENQLAKNSRNSSKPPSTDGFQKPSPKSLRKIGQRNSGGQPGHTGHTLKIVDKPDHTKVHHVEMCECCRRSLADQEPEGLEKRQVHDLPPQADHCHRASGRDQSMFLRTPQKGGLPQGCQRSGAIRRGDF